MYVVSLCEKKEQPEKKFGVAELRMLRWMCSVTKMFRIKNKEEERFISNNNYIFHTNQINS